MKMTNRERVLKVLRGQKPDRVPWFGDLSYWTHYMESSGKMLEEYKEDGMFRLHRNLGVGYYLQCHFPFKAIHENVKVDEKISDNLRITRIDTPVGTLQEIWRYLPESYAWAPQEHFVKGVEDLRAIRYFYEHTSYEADYRQTQERYELIGDNGIVMAFLPKSPLMEMVALLAGIEAATYAKLDDPDEFNETMEVLGKKADEAATVSLNSPAECLMIPENLSSEVIGKGLFELHMRTYEEKWNRRIKEAGKYSFVHMDGTMKGLIREVSSTGFSVLEALTPAPVGDIPMDEIHKWVNEDIIIWGGIPGVYFTDMISDNDFDEFVKSVLEVMKAEPRYVLGAADQVPPGCRFERIGRVCGLVEKYGIYHG
jgi:uroporphyrinogen-III decarboxylase